MRELIYDKPGQKRLGFGTKPTLWSEPDSGAINPAAGTAEVDGRRVGQSLVAVQTTLEDGAPGKEVGHTQSDSPVHSWHQECLSVGNRPSDRVGWGSHLGFES